ncbi:hypothetical protein RB653_009393 [Dictyostelium firmibasis]|uniref:Uncharacterized protein n=1 Tax=Dictyostelium firmibasis TaxID=79012 RepID=A0AAN7TVE8_9MYCE
MKLILSLIILIITTIAFSNGIKINTDESISKTTAPISQFINFIPYDSDCKNPIPGIVFATIGGYYCVSNVTGDSDVLNAHFTDDTNEYVNLTSSNDGYCTESLASQIFKVGQCGYYEYSKTNYYVSISNGPNIPKNEYVMQDFGPMCGGTQSYWYFPSGTTTTDYFYNQTSTYTCEGSTPYVSVCNGIGAPRTPSNCVNLKNVQTCFYGYNSNPWNIYCS